MSPALDDLPRDPEWLLLQLQHMAEVSAAERSRSTALEIERDTVLAERNAAQAEIEKLRLLIPTAVVPDRSGPRSIPRPPAVDPPVGSGREGSDGGGDHAAGAGRGRAAARGGPVPGRAGGTADARPGAGAGGRLARDGGAGGRHGPAELARLGPPLQRGGPRRPARPASTGAQATAHARTGGGAGGGGGAGAGPGPRRGGALAAGRPPGADRDPLRRPAARAHRRQGAAPARLRAHLGAPEAPQGRRGGAGGVQKGFADLVAAA